MKTHHAIGIALGSLLLYIAGTILVIDRIYRRLRKAWM